mmetsp:Transcript_35885/g.80916  ORF Transcript_35885/g.80916 Transcript_35885/m.80916 type:complete len:209 (+) Transcript_35885:1102-1728(+)
MLLDKQLHLSHTGKHLGNQVSVERGVDCFRATDPGEAYLGRSHCRELQEHGVHSAVRTRHEQHSVPQVVKHLEHHTEHGGLPGAREALHDGVVLGPEDSAHSLALLLVQAAHLLENGCGDLAGPVLRQGICKPRQHPVHQPASHRLLPRPRLRVRQAQQGAAPALGTVGVPPGVQAKLGGPLELGQILNILELLGGKIPGLSSSYHLP